jgi:hypothetical protein
VGRLAARFRHRLAEAVASVKYEALDLSDMYTRSEGLVEDGCLRPVHTF